VTVGDGLPVHRHMVDKTDASRQVTRHVSQRDRLAKHVLPRRINEIVHGKRAIPADTALRVSRALGLTDMFWIINATEG